MPRPPLPLNYAGHGHKSQSHWGEVVAFVFIVLALGTAIFWPAVVQWLDIQFPK